MKLAVIKFAAFTDNLTAKHAVQLLLTDEAESYNKTPKVLSPTGDGKVFNSAKEAVYDITKESWTLILKKMQSLNKNSLLESYKIIHGENFVVNCTKDGEDGDLLEISIQLCVKVDQQLNRSQDFSQWQVLYRFNNGFSILEMFLLSIMLLQGTKDVEANHLVLNGNFR
uniref:Uncharacterized protein n=1 Tax=Trichogramma kaykai TaxID=54128 RepID=A0ABD2WMN1_9HYME